MQPDPTLGTPRSAIDTFPTSLGRRAQAMAQRPGWLPREEANPNPLADTLLADGMLLFRPAPPVPFHPPYDWDALESQPTWWRFQLHALYVVGALLRDNATSGNAVALDRAVAIALSWLDTHPTPKRGTIGASCHPWSDHATARRSEMLGQLLTVLCLGDATTGSGDTKIIRRLHTALLEHAALLADPAFARKHHNHGWDQAKALWSITHLIDDDPRAAGWREYAHRWLRQESAWLFGADGGPMENSPFYAIRAVRLIDAFVELAAPDLTLDDLLSDGAARFANAVLALAALIRPDGFIPPFGDTDPFSPIPHRPPARSDPAVDAIWRFAHSRGADGAAPTWISRVLPISGWASLRNHWPTAPADPTAIHVVVKCGPHSAIHLHDDDGHFTLWAGGEEWLIDCARFEYAEKHPIRLHLRSRLSHNVLQVGPPRERPRQIDDQRLFWQVRASSDDGTTPFVTVESTRDPGSTRTRTVALSDDVVLVRDEARRLDDEPAPMSLRWHVAADRRVDVGDREVIVTSASGGRMTMTFTGDAPTRIVAETGIIDERIAAICSPRFTAWEPATVIVVEFGNRQKLQVFTRIAVEPGDHRAAAPDRSTPSATP